MGVSTVAASTNLTPEQRSQRARMAALARWSREDPKQTAQRASSGLRARIERETAEKFPGLDPAELARRADAAFRLHMTRLSFKSSRVRQARAAKSASGGADAA
jgi:hypothetical protein